MSQPLDFLSDSDVRQITSLVDTLDRSNFDFLQVDVGNMKVTIGKGPLPNNGGGMSIAPAALAAVQAPAAGATPTVAAPGQAGVAVAPAPDAQPAGTAPPPGWRPVTATTMGRFYSRPDPKSPPFVKLGDKVAAEDTIGLIEVMKLFNAITAGAAGTVVQICVEDAAVVEFGQVLLYVKA
jgi:acetyl-CoA carboxylase biotin carboxyl carrier protein